MKKSFKCEITTSNGQKFEIEYDSQMESKNDSFKPTSIIQKVKLFDYELMRGALREKEVWHEIVAAVDNNAVYQWDEFWKAYELRTAPTLERQIDNSLHPVFQDIFESLGFILKPYIQKSKQLDNVENISQQGLQC